MKKKRIEQVRLELRVDRIFVLTLVFVILVVVFFVGNKLLSGNELDILVADEFNEEIYEVDLVMVGDNLIHSSIYKDANKNANYDGYDFKPIYTYIKEIVSNYDLAYYNQETILGGAELGLSSYPCFNSPYEVGDAMIDAGFNLVSLATNHTLDRGESAIKNSCEFWSKKESVMTAGSYCSEEDRNAVQIMMKNNISYSMLSYTYGTNGIHVPSGKEYLVNVWPTKGNNPENDSEYQAYKKIVKEDIERVRDQVDVLMVAMHWGVEYTHTPTAYQKDMAQYLADQGVDIIIGSHPHVVMPVTFIDDTLVIYSLGKLVSAQETNLDYAKMVGLMSSVKITKTVKGEESTITLSDVNNELLFTYYSGWRNFKIVPFSSPDIGDYIWDYERLYDKYSAVIKDLDETIPVVSLSK